MPFQIGDKIVYPNQGVGIIEQISSRNLTGRAETFYLLKLQSNGLRVMVPMTNVASVGLRRVRRNAETEPVPNNLNNAPGKPPTDWRGRSRRTPGRRRPAPWRRAAEFSKPLLGGGKGKPPSFGGNRRRNRPGSSWWTR